MEHYYSLARYLKETYGGKVYKLALSGGFTCPNRDGTVGQGGCIFCSAGGSGDFAEQPCGSIREQIGRAKARVAKKAKGAVGYIAYFQSYTNTYAPVSVLEPLFLSAMAEDDIVGISIATRPDCLGKDVIDLLERLNRIKPVMVELGLQTIHPATAAYIRRGYPLSVYDEAISDLRRIGVHTVTHVILGLPHESPEMMLETVRYVGEKGSNGIKLQLLHVMGDTDLAEEYRKGVFTCMDEDAYISLVCDCLEILPPETVIHRLTGDAPKRTLLAPLWSANKREVRNRMAAYMRLHDLKQGSKYRP